MDIPQPNINPVSADQEKIPSSKKPYFFLGVVALFVLISGSIGFLAGRKSLEKANIEASPTLVPMASVQPSPISEAPLLTPSPEPVQEELKEFVKKKVSIGDVPYTLPANWRFEKRDESIFFFPGTGGGYLILSAYEYPGTIGRREFYCKVTGNCIKETYFSETTIGNIPGYQANALDNSGGGLQYFAAKGTTFYVFTSYAPLGFSDYMDNYIKLMNSFVF